MVSFAAGSEGLMGVGSLGVSTIGLVAADPPMSFIHLYVIGSSSLLVILVVVSVAATISESTLFAGAIDSGSDVATLSLRSNVLLEIVGLVGLRDFPRRDAGLGGAFVGLSIGDIRLRLSDNEGEDGETILLSEIGSGEVDIGTGDDCVSTDSSEGSWATLDFKLPRITPASAAKGPTPPPVFQGWVTEVLRSGLASSSSSSCSCSRATSSFDSPSVP